MCLYSDTLYIRSCFICFFLLLDKTQTNVFSSVDNYTNMVKVMISNVSVHNNPAKFLSNFTFEIKFECLEQLTQGRTNELFIVKYVSCSFFVLKNLNLNLSMLVMPKKINKIKCSMLLSSMLSLQEHINSCSK
jgi:hypothetical protein